MGFIKQGSKQEQSQSQDQRISEEDLASKQLLMRYIFGLQQQGPAQSFTDWQQNGPRAFPQMPIGLNDVRLFDPYGTDPNLMAMATQRGPGGAITLPGVNKAGNQQLAPDMLQWLQGMVPALANQNTPGTSGRFPLQQQVGQSQLFTPGQQQPPSRDQLANMYFQQFHRRA